MRTFYQDDEGTFSQLYVGIQFLHYTLEPPWRNNERNRSCIPGGRYECVWHQSPRFGGVYRVTTVPNRSYVLHHPGNFGGDTEKAFKTNTQACILHGKHIGHLWNGKRMQRAILSSRIAITDFIEIMKKAPFIVEIAR